MRGRQQEVAEALRLVLHFFLHKLGIPGLPGSCHPLFKQSLTLHPVPLKTDRSSGEEEHQVWIGGYSAFVVMEEEIKNHLLVFCLVLEKGQHTAVLTPLISATFCCSCTGPQSPNPPPGFCIVRCYLCSTVQPCPHIGQLTLSIHSSSCLCSVFSQGHAVNRDQTI